MATEASLGAGDLPSARRWARQLADHPLLAEVGHRATSWLLVADALAGNVDEVLADSVRFLEAWQRAGSPARPVLGPAAAGVAMIHGLRDDREAHRVWRAVLNQLGTPPEHIYGYGAGCRYQSARTLVLAGGVHAKRGAAALGDLGLAPMGPGRPRTTTT